MQSFWLRVFLALVALGHLTFLFQKEARDASAWLPADSRQRWAPMSGDCDTQVANEWQRVLLLLRCYPREFPGRRQEQPQ